MKIKASARQSLRALIAASLLVFGASAKSLYVVSSGSENSVQNQSAWQKLTAQEDNFSIQLPVQPEIRGRGESTFGRSGERISEERIATAYHNGVVYVIRILEAPNPQKLFSKYPEIFRLSDAAQSSVEAGGIKGKQYLKKGEDYFHFFRLFPAKKHLYVLEAAARSETHPDLRRFLLSLTLGETSAAATASVPVVAGTETTGGTSPPLAPSGTKPLSDKEVTRPAVIIHKPQPPYTSLAKRNQVSGTIKLRLVLSPSGEVTEVDVSRGLTGLTAAVKEIAKSIKFLPAEKDGQLVPQYAEVEYNFVLR